MANRRISEFPAISGGDIVDQDLLTLVQVFEADPALRNKKITFTEFRSYLDQYYTHITGATFNGSVVINGDLTVTGVTSLGSASFNDLVTFSGIVVQNNIEASGTITAPNITGETAVFTNLVIGTGRVLNELSGELISGNTIRATNITGVSGVFTSSITSPIISGTNVQTSYITSVSGIFTSQVSGATVTGNTAGFTTVTGQTVTGINANFASGVFTNSLSGSTITGNTINAGTLNAVSGVFTDQISGQTITGQQIFGLSGVFVNLSAQNMVFGGDETISGSFTVLGAGSYGSGLIITGSTSGDSAYFTTITGDTITGNTGLFTDITGSTLHITTPSGSTPAIVCSGIVSGSTDGFVIKSPLIILP